MVMGERAFVTLQGPLDSTVLWKLSVSLYIKVSVQVGAERVCLSSSPTLIIIINQIKTIINQKELSQGACAAWSRMLLLPQLILDALGK